MSTDEIAKEIEQQFIAELKGLKLDPEEQTWVANASVRIASYSTAILAPTTPDQLAELKAVSDSAIATLANIGALKEIKAEQLFRTTAFNVIVRIIGIGLGALAAA